MGYTYGHRSTAFNGIWFWLQEKGYTKALRNGDQSYNYCINMIREFLQSKGIKEVKYRGKFDTMKNAMAVQSQFHEFVSFMKNKQL